MNYSQYPCPAGYFSDATDLKSSAECEMCTEGYTCPIGSDSTMRVLCRAGYYCPSGTALGYDQPCPAGTFSNMEGLSDSPQCTSCTPGKYCTGHDTAVSGNCQSGYYCPSGTSRPDQV